MSTTRRDRMTETATEHVTAPFEYDRQLVISVNVSNFDAAVDWYREALGFELVYRLDGYGWGEVRTPWGGVNIGLGQSEELKHGGTVPTFGVKDIAAARAHLESLGTRFDGDTYEIDGMVKLCTFYDPDGNAWMLAESQNRDAR
jgi:catechol 2,3-dioxygenase-like lactoylglutathione lyase family enzyme